MNKLTIILFALYAISISSCTKEIKDATVPRQDSTKPTDSTDFREKYVGNFSVVYKHTDTSYSSTHTYTSYAYSCNAQVSYSITDSVWTMSGKLQFFIPAVKIKYDKDSLQSELDGIELDGSLLRDHGYYGYDYGGFINSDSIFHVHIHSEGPTISIDTVVGKRIS